MDFAMAGYLSIQSLPRRVRICALPEMSRACIRYPSNLISCSQSEPSGALLTSAASCGLIQAGGEAGLTLRRVESVSVGFVRADLIIAAIYQEFAFCGRIMSRVRSVFSAFGCRRPSPADFIAGRFANGVAHSTSKIEYRAMLGGNLSPTPTAKILFSQA